jgi:hypothetical protein
MKTTLLGRADRTGKGLGESLAEGMGIDMLTQSPSRLVNATEFQELIVSNRRMERVACDEVRMRGLRDLDTGEVFLTDERRLFESRR